MTEAERLREMTDAELGAVVTELEHRAEQFSPTVRMLFNDELRRRKMPLLGAGVSRY